MDRFCIVFSVVVFWFFVCLFLLLLSELEVFYEGARPAGPLVTYCLAVRALNH